MVGNDSCETAPSVKEGFNAEECVLPSVAYDHIQSILGATREEVTDIWPMKQGLTNESWHFSTPKGEFVYRMPGIGTEDLINRKAEVDAQRVALELGLDGTFVFEDERTGWKISRFITNCRELDAHNPKQVAVAMKMIHDLHQSDATLKRTFDFYVESRRYERLLLRKGPITDEAFNRLRMKAAVVAAYSNADCAPVCLTHNDFFTMNILVDENDGMHLIDWEYAGMSDYAHDFGTFTVCCQLSEQEASDALDAYFGRPATLAERCHNFAYVALAGWCWYLWSLVKEASGGSAGEWRDIYLSYAETYFDKVIDGYERLQMERAIA